jgi:hypothetical protein
MAAQDLGKKIREARRAKKIHGSGGKRFWSLQMVCDKISSMGGPLLVESTLHRLEIGATQNLPPWLPFVAQALGTDLYDLCDLYFFGEVR